MNEHHSSTGNWIGIHILEDEEKTLMDVLCAIKDAVNSEGLCCILLQYEGNISNMELATGSKNITSKIHDLSTLQFTELLTIASWKEGGPQSCLIALFTDPSSANLFRQRNPEPVDIVIDCVDHMFWTIGAHDKALIQSVAKHFSDPRSVDAPGINHLRSLIERSYLRLD